MKEKELAASVKESAKNYMESVGIHYEAPFSIDGIPYSFPYSEVEYASWDEYIPEKVYESYEVLREIFDPENMPESWIKLIKEVGMERKIKGTEYPVNLVYGLNFFAKENPAGKSLLFKEFKRTFGNDPDFSDPSIFVNDMNKVLSDPVMREEFKKSLSILIADISNGYLPKTEVKKILRKEGIEKGIVLDVGCGIGGETSEWAAELDHTVLGLDRQYHPTWYNKHWKKETCDLPNLEFLRADFNEGLPFADNSIEAVIFQYVAQHVTTEAMENGLKEARRVLKSGGLVFIGPQVQEKYCSWRCFKKEKGEFTEI